MQRMNRVVIALVVVCLAAVSYQQKTAIEKNRNLARELSDNNRHAIIETVNLMSNINARLNAVIADHQLLDLVTLNSCGIITDGEGYGSCVAIAPDVLLTAGHCLEHEGLWIKISGKRYEVTKKWSDPSYDIGFVKIDGEVPYIKEFGTVELLDEVYVVSTPSSQELHNVITKGIVSKLNSDVGSWCNTVICDISTAGGSSGGPLFSKGGKLLGINVAGTKPGDNISIFVTAEQIQEALKRFSDRCH